MIKTYQCEFCKRTISYSNIGQHTKSCILNPNSEKYKKQNKERTCKKCGKTYTLSLVGSFENFCCISCRNSRVHSEETKLKTSNSLNRFYATHPQRTPARNRLAKLPEKFCQVCKKALSKKNKSGFCREHVHLKPVTEETRKKLSIAGRHSAQSQKESRRSKIEALFFEKIKNLFEDAEANKVIRDGWDSDVFIPSLNLAIFWNGYCHYFPIYDQKSLNATQNRDRIKKSLFEKMGIGVYIIKDVPTEYPKEIVKSREKRVDFQLKKFLETLEN